MLNNTAIELLLGCAPWLVLAAVVLWRVRGTVSLASRGASVESGSAPLLSVIVPARNEAHNISRCLESILRSNYPKLEVIVVDDYSDDETRQIAEEIAVSDSRVRVTSPEPLPEGWFGKTWACWHGARLAGGEILLFTDADTWHHPELHSRLYNALTASESDLLSIAGTQEVRSFWERLIQPLVFVLLLLRYGGAAEVNRSRHVRDKIANGQCIMVRRSSYERVGGHESVRNTVAEDLRLAQIFFEGGCRTTLEVGLDYLSTRMYTGLRDLREGWGKNIFAGSVHTIPRGWIFRALVPVLLVAPPLLVLLLPLMLILAATGLTALPLLSLLTSNICMLLLATAMYQSFGVPAWYALLLPLGAFQLLRIVAGAIGRGARVSWKGRSYVSR